MATLQERLDLMQGRRQPSELQERLNRMKQGLSPASASKGIAPLMAQKALESPSLPLAVKRSLEPKAAPASKSSNGAGVRAASSYLTGGAPTQAAPYGAGLQAQMSKDQEQTATPQVREQETTPDPMIQKNQAVLRQGYQVAKDYQNAQRLTKKYQKQAEEYQRLTQLDIGAARQELSDMEAECAELEKEFRAAEQAQNVPMDILYRDGQEAYDAAQAAADERVNTAFAAWDAKKKDVIAKKEVVEQAKAVQYYMIPARDDFEVYAARGAEMKGNPVMPVKRGSDGANAALAAAETLFPRTQGFSPTQSIYDQLTDEEARIYNYLFAKDAERGTDKASEYLAFMRDPMTARRGREYADFVKNSGIFRPGLTLAYGVGSGFDRAMTGIAQNFSDEPIPTSAFQYGAGYTREDLADVGPKILGHSVGQIGFDVASTAGNMAPAIAVSAATGNPLTGAAVTFASAGGNAYGEALAQGYDQRSARAYGVLAGVSEAGLQYALGGISSLGGKVVNSNGIQAALNNIERAVLRIPAKYAVAATGEMTEEYLQEILDPMFRNLALGENNEFKLFTEDAAYSALLAALSVGVLEGPNIVSTDVNLDRMGQTLRGHWGADASSVTDVLIRMGLNQEQGSDAYQAAQAAKKQLGKGHALTNVALGSLYQNVMGSIRGEGSLSAAERGVNQQLDLNITDKVATSDKRKIKQLVPATIAQLKLFIKNAFQGKNTHQYIKIADVDPALADIVKQFGIDITGFSHVLKDNDIRHINKSHGEKSSDKYKVTIDMLANVQHVIDHYDTIYLGYDTKEGRQTIVYEKRDGTRTFYVEEVLEEGGLSSKQMLVVGENSKPSFLKKYKKAINRTPDTDVAAFGRTTSDSSPGNHVQDAEDSVDLSDSIPQPPTGVNLRRSLPGDIPANIPPGLRKLYRLAQEMSASPPPREIPQRPVQQSPQEILSQLAREMAQDSLQGGALDGLSNEDIRAMLEEIARRQSGETALAEADASAENGDEPFTDETSHGIIDIGRSLGAKAANYDVMDLDTGEIFHFTEGTRIQNVEVFAGKGSRVIFRNAAKYAERFGGDAKDWQHVKGFGILSTPDGDRKAEVHWVQCAGIGKFRFFVKEWLD